MCESEFGSKITRYEKSSYVKYLCLYLNYCLVKCSGATRWMALRVCRNGFSVFVSFGRSFCQCLMTLREKEYACVLVRACIYIVCMIMRCFRNHSHGPGSLECTLIAMYKVDTCCFYVDSHNMWR